MKCGRGNSFLPFSYDTTVPVGGISSALVTPISKWELLGIPLAFWYGLVLCGGLWYALEFTPEGRHLVVNHTIMNRGDSSIRIFRMSDCSEVWNEVNLDREWGGARIDKQQAGQYVDLLGRAYLAAKAADSNVIVVTAGLSPTGP